VEQRKAIWDPYFWLTLYRPSIYAVHVYSVRGIFTFKFCFSSLQCISVDYIYRIVIPSRQYFTNCYTCIRLCHNGHHGVRKIHLNELVIHLVQQRRDAAKGNSLYQLIQLGYAPSSHTFFFIFFHSFYFIFFFIAIPCCINFFIPLLRWTHCVTVLV